MSNFLFQNKLDLYCQGYEDAKVKCILTGVQSFGFKVSAMDVICFFFFLYMYVVPTVRRGKTRNGVYLHSVRSFETSQKQHLLCLKVSCRMDDIYAFYRSLFITNLHVLS